MTSISLNMVEVVILSENSCHFVSLERLREYPREHYHQMGTNMENQIKTLKSSFFLTLSYCAQTFAIFTALQNANLCKCKSF